MKLHVPCNFQALAFWESLSFFVSACVTFLLEWPCILYLKTIQVFLITMPFQETCIWQPPIILLFCFEDQYAFRAAFLFHFTKDTHIWFLANTTNGVAVKLNFHKSSSTTCNQIPTTFSSLRNIFRLLTDEIKKQVCLPQYMFDFSFLYQLRVWVLWPMQTCYSQVSCWGSGWVVKTVCVLGYSR